MDNLAFKIGNQDFEPPGALKHLEGGAGTVEKIFQSSIIILIVVAIIFSLIYMVWGGMQWSYSGGNKESIQKARQRITFAIMGLIIAILAIFIISFVGGLFGTTIISP